MYAIAFDLEIAELKKHYGEPYNGAYFEVKSELEKSVLNGLKAVFIYLKILETI